MSIWRKLLLAAAVLASIPWQGIAYHDHTGWRTVPLGRTGLVIMRQWVVPICIHMDWRSRRMVRPPEGSLRA